MESTSKLIRDINEEVPSSILRNLRRTILCKCSISEDVIYGICMGDGNMQKAAECFLVKSEDRVLGVKALFSFMRGEVWSREIYVAGESLIVVKIPEFVKESESRWQRILAFLHSIILKRKTRDMNLVSELPKRVKEACLLQFIKRECRFRRDTHVLIVDEGKVDFEEVISPYCEKLNFLQIYTDGPDRVESYQHFLDRLYDDNGLSAGVTWNSESIEAADIVLDMIEEPISEFLMESGKLGQSCLYFDCFCKEEKERILRRQRGDITYISPMIYLDRALKNAL